MNINTFDSKQIYCIANKYTHMGHA